MGDRTRLAAASRDGHLTLARVERQQVLIEHLHAARGRRITMQNLAHDLGVSTRTVGRDVERLRLSGVPLDVRPGRGGGIRLDAAERLEPVRFDISEAAAVMSSLTVLGPSATLSAGSAMRKLTEAILEPRR